MQDVHPEDDLAADAGAIQSYTTAVGDVEHERIL
jgi:hypothetical protein